MSFPLSSFLFFFVFLIFPSPTSFIFTALSISQVVFSLYRDEKTNKEVAKNVRLTDEAIPGMSGDQTGVLDVVVLR